MTVKITKTRRGPERIMVVAGSGVGKTASVVSIAEHCPEAHFYVLELDVSPNWLISIDDTEIPDRASETVTEIAAVDDEGNAVVIEATTVGNVTVVACHADWSSYKMAVTWVIAQADPDTDWIVLDSISPTWQMCQNWYLYVTYGNDLAELQNKVRLETEKMPNPIAAFNLIMTERMHWPTINKNYGWLYAQLTGWRGHLFITARATKISDRDKGDIVEVFGQFGVKPEGQKDMQFMANTRLMLTRDKRDSSVRLFTTAKDLKRDEYEEEPFTDFALEYLVEVGKWTRVMPGKVAK